MVELKVILQAKWEKYLKSLADGHQTDLNNVINELCQWAFFNPEGKVQFESWLDDAYPAKGETEDKDSEINEEVSETEEEMTEESEEEGHSHKD
jgi:hypothetical protein